MQKYPFVFNQIMELAPRYEFNKLVKKHAESEMRTFTYWQQFKALIFAQLTRRESLRDTVLALNSHNEKLYQLGFTEGIKRSTFAQANQERKWEVFKEFAFVLIEICKEKDHKSTKVSNNLQSIFDNIYAFDSSTITMNIFRFNWAKYKSKKSGVKLHTLYEIKKEIPEFILITEAKTADSKVMKDIPITYNSMYVFDRAYMDLTQLHRISINAFFLVRAKRNLSFIRYISRKVDKTTGLIYDQEGKMKSKRSRSLLPERIRVIKYRDPINKTIYVYITNNLEIEALDIVQLYIHRWEIEIFFKWIKQHLHIKKFWGYSENAVKIQLWTAISSFLLIYLVKNKYKTEFEMNEITQILSLSLLETKPITEVLMHAKEDSTQKDYTQVQQTLF